MDFTTYALKSKKRKEVSVPSECASKAQELVDALMGVDEFNESVIDRFPILTSNIAIGRGAVVLVNDKENLAFQDALYLRVCVYHLVELKKLSKKEFIKLAELENELMALISEIHS